ncbi:Heavy metal transport/detoxification superfamily protein [Hibiscus syriacus]|uniref:Heavy metal transport/detoxification superfamily protein n=1 Tax=Hibiscus syriacus TaxID=106335 RepID=A0A6A3CQL2_HIBSY|nr:Heavy metal transport/detoxification superfamily protein [Hibiscus syriacus]
MLDIPEEQEKTRNTPSRAYARGSHSSRRDRVPDILRVHGGHAGHKSQRDQGPGRERIRSGVGRHEKQGVKYVSMERRIGKFIRKFQLPDKISAVVQDEVLKVTVDKILPPQPKTIELFPPSAQPPWWLSPSARTLFVASLLVNQYRESNATEMDSTFQEVDSGTARCWRGSGGLPFPSPGIGLGFRAITSGSGFTCGILKNDSEVLCWGGNKMGLEIQSQFSNLSMSILVAGDSHACGLTRQGFLVCKGKKESRKLDVPSSSAFEFSGVSVGGNFGCGIRRRNGLVQCWVAGVNRSEFVYDIVKDVSFESLVAGLNFICGLTTRNLTVICWGPGWSNGVNSRVDLPLGMVIPGPCVQVSCNCGTYLNSEHHFRHKIEAISPPRKGISKLSLASFIVGSIGAFAGVCTVFYCLWTGMCGFLLRKTHNSVQPTVIDANIITTVVDNNDTIAPPVRSFSIRRTSSRRLGRERSGSSSSKRADKTQHFLLSELADATNTSQWKTRLVLGASGLFTKANFPMAVKSPLKEGRLRQRAFDRKKAVFRNDEDGTGPMGVVEYAIPRLSAGDLRTVVDRRVGVPEIHEAEAVELMAYTAMQCVNLEGKERPNMIDIVANLEKSLSLCQDSPASLSSRTISIPSE